MAVLGLPVTVLLDREGNEVGALQGDADWDLEASMALIREADRPRTSEGRTRKGRPLIFCAQISRGARGAGPPATGGNG